MKRLEGLQCCHGVNSTWQFDGVIEGLMVRLGEGLTLSSNELVFLPTVMINFLEMDFITLSRSTLKL